jgi:HEAT repeat protein
VAAIPARPDIDVDVPPGAPVDWARSFPAITPGAGPLFPTTPPKPPPTEEQRTRVRDESPKLDVRFSSSFNLTRILTHDIVVELGWIETRPNELPVSGRSTLLPEPPQPGDPVYWVSLASLLRLLLHPSVAPRTEIEVHLIEIGTPTLPVLDSADSQGYLRKTCNRVREAVEPRRDRAPAPRVGSDEVESMLNRFVFDELRREHPYDPVGSFGERLFLFGEELEPYVAAYATNSNAYLRRSAVAALGRYRTESAMQALISIAATTTDPVSLVRSLASVGRVRLHMDVSPLMRRLEGTRDAIERTALIGALGRLEAREAIPLILQLGEEGLARTDSDLLFTVFTALARIRPGEHSAAVNEFALEMEKAARSRPMELKPKGGSSPVKADRPDGRTQRARVLSQLALVVRTGLDPLDAELQTRVLELLNPADVGDPLQPSAEWLNTASLSRVESPVRHAYLDLLERMDTAGRAPLVQIVEDPGLDAALRGYALSRLPWGERGPRVVQLLDEGANALLRIHALQLADRDDHPALDRIATLELERCAALPSGLGSPEQRYLCLASLRALGSRGRLKAADVLPLLHHAASPREAFGDFPDRLRVRVEEAVRDAASSNKTTNRNAAEALLELVRSAGANPALEETSREALLSELTKALVSARAHKNDVVFLELAVKRMLELLLGYPQPGWSRELAEFRPEVLLEEEILLALGRTAEPEAVVALQQLLENRKSRLRAVTCLALGIAGDPSAASHLAPYLMDTDGFTRWCAYRSLSHLSGIELPIDWMYGQKEARYQAAQEMWKRLMEPR